MAMRKSTRRELRKLRELTAYLLCGERCCFCKEPVLELDVAFGDADGPCLAGIKVCLHHKNGDHSDNRKANLRLAHQTCHKSYHMRLQRRAMR